MGASVGIPLVKPARDHRRNFQFDTEFDYREHFESPPSSYSGDNEQNKTK